MENKLGQISFIGILEDKGRNIILHMIKEIFVSAGFSVIFSNKTENILVLQFEDKSPIVIIEIIPEYLEFLSVWDLNFQIIVHTNFEEDKNINKMKKFFNNIEGIIILNIDDEVGVKLLQGNNKSLVMTYGLNNKATITASSLDIDNKTKFNFCLQRKMITINKQKIEPLEFPIQFNLIGKSNIYNALAAISVALCYEIDINIIKKSLFNINQISRRFEKIYEQDFVVIDNYCSTSSDYNVTFETIQHLDYNNIIIIDYIDSNKNINLLNKNLKVICNWIPVLGNSKILFFLDKKNEVIERNLDLILKKEGIIFDKYYYLEDCVNKSFDFIKKGDILLLLGEKKMNNAKEILMKKLTS